MADEAVTTTADEATTTSADESTADAQQQEPAGAEALGDAGKKALDAMKAERNAARTEARTLREQIADLQAKVEGREAEREADRKDRAAFAKGILRAEVKAAATGVLEDPKDALMYLDLTKFDVGPDGEVDTDAISAEIGALIKTKPYLAAQGGKRFQGTADGGTRTETPPQTLDDQIAAAEKAGEWTTARRLKAQKLTELPTT